MDAAMAMNEGSQPPLLLGTAVGDFDRGTVERDGWDIKPPFTADNGYFFSADTIEQLAQKIQKGHEFQRVPLKSLAETVRKWNSHVDAGADPDLARQGCADAQDRQAAFLRRLDLPGGTTYGGLRINGKGQVLDTQGEVIPGLYCGERRAAAATSTA